MAQFGVVSPAVCIGGAVYLVLFLARMCVSMCSLYLQVHMFALCVCYVSKKCGSWLCWLSYRCCHAHTDDIIFVMAKVTKLLLLIDDLGSLRCSVLFSLALVGVSTMDESVVSQEALVLLEQCRHSLE